jgi:peptidoglycan/LPS O-acetylase OafA/YrhL
MGQIAPLTSLRFFAALWVLLFHLRIHLGSPQPFVLERLLLAGPLAMTFFFALSGFILVVASQGKEPWLDFPGYAWRRFARIYPIYIAYLLLFWSTIGFAGDLGGSPLRGAVLLGLSDFTLTSAWFPQAFLGGFGRDGSWSLSAEVFFYGLFPLILLHARQLCDRKLMISLYWSVSLAALGPILGRYLPPQGAVPSTVYYSLPIFRLPEFTAGVFYAIWVLRDPARLPSGRKVALWLIGLAAFLCVAARALPYAGNDIILLPALLLLFSYFLREQKGWAAQLLSTRLMVFLGEISFSLYLMQIVTISLYRKPGHGDGYLGGALGCFVLTILLAILVHLLVEKPMRIWLLSKKGETR